MVGVVKMYLQNDTGRLIADNISNINVDTNGIVGALEDIKQSIDDISIGAMTYITQRRASNNAITVPTATHTSILSLTLPIGTWIITGTLIFPSNATGYRQVYVANSADSTSAFNAITSTMQGFTGTINNLPIAGVVVMEQAGTIYARVRQNSGADMDVYGVINAIKIL